MMVAAKNLSPVCDVLLYRKLALEKADAIVHHIAYPVELFEVKRIAEYYNRVSNFSDNFSLVSLLEECHSHLFCIFYFHISVR